MRKYVGHVAIFCILIVLTGCGKDSDSSNQARGGQPVAQTTPEQKAHAYCVSQGNEIEIVTDDAGRHIYCILTDGTPCEAGAYFSGTCPQEQQEHVVSIEGEESMRFCEPVADPVCGSDGKTYTNSCIAQQYGVSIAYEEPCRGTEPPSNPSSGSSESNPSNPTPPLGNGSISPIILPSMQEQELPQWLPMAVALASHYPSATMYSCPIGGSVYYVLSGVRGSEFRILYDSTGSVQCFPLNDIQYSCPVDVSGSLSGTCQVVWRK